MHTASYHGDALSDHDNTSNLHQIDFPFQYNKRENLRPDTAELVNCGKMNNVNTCSYPINQIVNE